MARIGTTRTIALLALACALSLSSPATGLAISRDQVMSRARVWVNASVPYSQKVWASDEGSATVMKAAGYRTDCSGFVSMALNLRTKYGSRYSMTTATLGRVMRRIPKSSLKPGDVILRPSTLYINGRKVAYGHAIIFGGWVDAAHSYYVGYHESGSSKGAVRAVIRWGSSGFWSEPGFAAYRACAVHDRTKIGAVVSR